MAAVGRLELPLPQLRPAVSAQLAGVTGVPAGAAWCCCPSIVPCRHVPCIALVSSHTDRHRDSVPVAPAPFAGPHGWTAEVNLVVHVYLALLQHVTRISIEEGSSPAGTLASTMQAYAGVQARVPYAMMAAV